MIKVTVQGHKVFLEGNEMLEGRLGDLRVMPAHECDISCWGTSPDRTHLVTADRDGRLKVWNLRLPSKEQKTWDRNGFLDATAVGVTNSGAWVAVAYHLVVVVCKLIAHGYSHGHDLAVEVGQFHVPLENVTRLCLNSEHEIICYDAEQWVMLNHDPAWKVMSASVNGEAHR